MDIKLKDALTGRRSIRRFKQKDVSESEITDIIDMARLSASAGNAQPLRYVVVRSNSLVKSVFDNVAWAAYIKPLRTPKWGVSAPRCFIAVTAPAGFSNMAFADAGAAIQSLMLAAHGKGLGACWIGAFDRSKIDELLAMPNNRQVIFLVALGYPDENPVSQNIAANESIKYYLDEKDCLHVPKIRTADLIEWL
ncbi:MAG: nitroreductase family protein [Victivallaceae bacterium]|jgi:nitroreductase|nr:nitroreductase family protein [Victivallaceae bacterium]NLK83273.1 nitroreductase [Lentisphaerota bacterium]MDD3115841.1 nitroreductase family protein [Victivallaceae bacterium]MDD3702738.1 nitroreductase family protein [Victivallaceae bacterium]MDD4317525.1 nitroreductase family protein [Victivallaceae bacterium]